MVDAALAELAAGLPGDAVLTDPASTDAYRHDQAGFCPAGTPLAVVRPSTTEQVRHVMRVATAHRVPVVPQGARTGLSGAANAVDGCLVLSLTRMDRILEIDPVDQVAVVEPGVVNAALSRAVAAEGLHYPPDPSSWELSTIGGNIATNAGGLCCVKYGVTADFVRGLEVVTASGELLRTGRRPAKGVAGYDLTRLLVGSEGTLGVVTRATLALRPVPEAALTIAAVFGSAADALTAAARIMAAGLRPSLLEFLDSPTVRAIQDYRDMGLPGGARALLLAQSDRGPRAGEDVAAMGRVCVEAGALEIAEASDAAESAMLMEARRLVNPALEKLGVTLVDDVAVPRARLPVLLEGITGISAEYGVRVCCPGHVGDGNMHPTVVFDRGDPAAAERAGRAFGAIMRLGLSLGGTITGEHGVGVLKRDWLARELGPLGTRLHRDIKAVFDPLGILNPGKVLP
ncbi:putative FAD-linked oxidoreductase [Streptomyces sp. enrichment culture]|uniref:FAD-binding oxidoreductase n=1 Tax=Streptomyces sp. enrichment culture TaxID=1795815 RepID=UPI003F54FDD3